MEGSKRLPKLPPVWPFGEVHTFTSIILGMELSASVLLYCRLEIKWKIFISGRSMQHFNWYVYILGCIKILRCKSSTTICPESVLRSLKWILNIFTVSPHLRLIDTKFRQFYYYFHRLISRDRPFVLFSMLQHWTCAYEG